ncbi:MAG: hypothetical protein WA510_13565, partial [Acidobacteriaceae bacterium]
VFGVPEMIALTWSDLNMRTMAVKNRLAQLPPFTGDESPGARCRHTSCSGVDATLQLLTTLDVYTRAVDPQKRDASLKVVALIVPPDVEKFSAPFRTLGHAEGASPMPANSC